MSLGSCTQRGPFAEMGRTVASGLADELCALGRRAGLDAVGVAPAEPLVRARAALEDRARRGLHAGMAFTYKNPARSTDPGQVVRGAKAMVVGARRYLRAPPPVPGGVVGRVARYAWQDHYEPLRAALWAVAHELRSHGWKAVAFADDNSLVDREAAWLAGIGWFGKNANLLLPGAGSWFVLGAVVTDAPLPPSPAPVEDGCASCRRCLDGCPTAAIIAPGVVDANRCLAWLAQKPGMFDRRFRVALGDRLYGCDDCQEVCPPNHRHERDVPPAPPATDAQAYVDVLALLGASDAELLDRYGRWYLAERDPRWLRRNALIILGNCGDAHDGRLRAALAVYLAHADAMLRAHALWAARRLGLHELAARLDGDDDPEVVQERCAPAPPPCDRPIASGSLTLGSRRTDGREPSVPVER